jgi:hypothetical protein
VSDYFTNAQKSRYSGNYISLNIRLKSSGLHFCPRWLRKAEVCSMLQGQKLVCGVALHQAEIKPYETLTL